MKRGREVDSIITMANYLMLLSGRGRSSSSSKRSVFECKTCKRQFASFQALGGHRASHKKPRLMMGESDDNQKPKTHECSICGLEFAIGQALGGHMRGHRPPNPNNHPKTPLFPDLNLTPLENDLEFFKIRQASLL